MKEQEESWSLFRLSDRKQFDGISLSKVEFLFESLPAELHTNWLMWREGFSGWRPLNELPQILPHLQLQKAPSGAPPVPASVLKMAEEITAGGFKVPQQAAGEPAQDLDEVTQPTIRTADIAEEIPQRLEAVGEAKAPPTDAAAESDAPAATDETVTKSDFRKQTVSIRAISAATSSIRKRNELRETNPSIRVVGEADKNQSEDEASLAIDGVPPRVDSGLRTNSVNHDMKVLSLPDEATLSLMLDSQAAVEDRNGVRYNRKFRLKIYTPAGIVKTSTIDASVSGLRLSGPIPEGLPRFFHVEIELGAEGRIPLLCSVIRERDGSPSTRLRIQVNDHVNLLKAALMRAS